MTRPTKRPGSSVYQFVQRIPADVIGRAAGLRLDVPLGADLPATIVLSPKAVDVRLSLRTSDAGEAKRRSAEADAYLERVWTGLRAPGPVRLDRRQATALSGRLYRSWVDGMRDRTRTTAVEFVRGQWVPTFVTPEEEAAFYAKALKRMNARLDEDEPENLEPALGPIVDRLLLAEGILAADVVPESRAMLLIAFGTALRDAFARLSREADGDYSPDPIANRFPEWRRPEPSPDGAGAGDTPAAAITARSIGNGQAIAPTMVRAVEKLPRIAVSGSEGER